MNLEESVCPPLPVLSISGDDFSREAEGTSPSTEACSSMVTLCPARAIPMAAARPPSPAPMTPTCDLISAMVDVWHDYQR